MAVLLAVPEPVIVKVVDELLGAEMVIVIADAEAGRSVNRRLILSRFAASFIVFPSCMYRAI